MITVDYKDRTPIFEQIVKNIENLIAMGAFSKDDKLPSVRNLAVELSINPNTIQKAYTKLEEMGLIYTVKGVGKFISNSEEQSKCAKLDAIYNQILEKFIEARKFGMTDENFDSWILTIKGEIKWLLQKI